MIPAMETERILIICMSSFHCCNCCGKDRFLFIICNGYNNKTLLETIIFADYKTNLI